MFRKDESRSGYKHINFHFLSHVFAGIGATPIQDPGQQVGLISKTMQR